MFFRFLIFAACAAIFVAAAFMLPTVDFPQTKAEEFLSQLKAGNKKALLEMFGDNTCKCPPRGGYQTFLEYNGRQEPNLAFLLAHPFNFNIGQTTPVDIQIPYVFPWDKPLTTYVDVNLTFPDNAYRPFFLPLEMAFGLPMSESQFNEFLANPNKDAWKGFTQRLRPTINKGVVEEKLPPEKDPYSKQQLENLLSPEMIPFLRATDAGPVLGKDKVKLPESQIEAQLPKLVSATLRFRIVKSGQLKSWMVNKFRFQSATIVENGKTSTIEFPLNTKFAL